LVVYFATPPLGVTTSSTEVPSLNVTVPVGVPPNSPLTVAVKVTDCPDLDGFSDDVSAVVVVAVATLWVNSPDVLPAKFASPLYFAANTLAPASRVEGEKLAVPLLSAAVPKDTTKLVSGTQYQNVTVPVAVPPYCPVTLAVSVTGCPKMDGFFDELSTVVVPA
jgi:hypothetical protein